MLSEMLKQIRERIKELYREMAEHTRPECGKCQIPHSCCASRFCELTAKIAREVWDVELEPTGHPIPFMGPDGCIAEPHLRPHCTLHTCAVNCHGHKPNDDQWNARYFYLKSEIDRLTGVFASLREQEEVAA